jgi:hypothetical protein
MDNDEREHSEQMGDGAAAEADAMAEMDAYILRLEKLLRYVAEHYIGTVHDVSQDRNLIATINRTLGGA